MTLMQADLEALKRALEHLGVEFVDGRSSGGEAEVLKEAAFGKPGARLKEQEKRAMKQPHHQIVGLIKQNPPGLREKVDAVMRGHLQQGTDPASISCYPKRRAEIRSSRVRAAVTVDKAFASCPMQLAPARPAAMSE